MFQLIVAVISIALVAALAIASIYYGGSAFSSSSLRANVVTLVNAGQQISGAQALYKTDYSVPATTIAALQPTYLSGAPGVSSIASGQWTLDTTGAFGVIGLNASNLSKVCAEATRQAAGNGQFGCGTSAGVIDGSSSNFVFKL